MSQHYQNLLNQLGQKIEIYQELADLLKKEWDCIAEYSLEELQEILVRKEHLLLQSQMVEENRNKIIGQLADELKIPQEELTLSKLIAARKYPLAQKLEDSRDRLLELISLIGDLSLKNKNLIEHSSLSLKKSLAFIHCVAEESLTSYHQNGRRGGNKMEGRMLNTKA